MSQEHPQRAFAVQVVERLKAAGHQALWAGGCVRDYLLERNPDDFDVATSAKPDQVREIFGKRRTLAVGASFGVIVVLGPKEAGQIEVATFRTDGEYLDGRHPESVSFGSAEEDAQRRDFTINGMFYDPIAERILDYVGGEQDLARRTIRAIGAPTDRFEEDKLRMLRAVRFAATLQFDLDEATANSIRELVNKISVVSAERIAHELKKMLASKNRSRAIIMAREVGLLSVILPNVDDVACDKSQWSSLLTTLDNLQETTFEVAAAALLSERPDFARAVGKNLKLSNAEVDRIEALCSHLDALNGASNFKLSKLKRLLVNDWARDLIKLSRARLNARNEAPTDVDFCESFLENTPQEVIDPKPFITGQDLIDGGLKPGPQFKTMLDRLRDAQLEDVVTNQNEAMEMLEQLKAELS